MLQNVKSECIDNLCGSYCSFRYHFFFNNVTSPISRGEDDLGRQFILFFYKTIRGDIYYEFICYVVL